MKSKKIKEIRKKTDNRLKQILALCLLGVVLLGTLAAQSFHNIFPFSTSVWSSLTPTPTPAPKTTRAKRKSTNSGNRGTNTSTNGAAERTGNNFSRVLATAEFNLIGLAVTVGPATQTVPKNTATAVLTSVQVPDGTNPEEIIAGLNPNYRIRGELVGPSLTSPRTVEARIGESLPIPPLSNTGDHILQNLRVVDTGAAGEPVIAPVEPDSCGIHVIERLLVSEVHVNELTYEQIVQSGINITAGNYSYYNFVLGIATTSGTVPINIPVAMPQVGGGNQLPVIGSPSSPAGPGTNVPMPDVLPVFLEIGDDEGGGSTPPMMADGSPARIPGLIVFPGRIGLLHQFFEAIVIVGNGAPNGTPLVVKNIQARAIMPDAGTPTDPTDDPLRIAQTQVGGIVSELEIHGLGADGRYGTADDTNTFSPGQSGQATFLLEGLKEGLHTVNFDLTGTLEGLPSGPVTVHGQVPGAVLVRDADFSVTFTHPSVVRAGQEYDLGMTIYNSGPRILNNLTVKLPLNSVSGATLLSAPVQNFRPTVKRGETATVKWRLRANTTGQVTATYVKVGQAVEAGLELVTGVGDRNVPLSPDSLILPEPVRHLPPEVVDAARNVLGQAWSVANAPSGTLPAGVKFISKQTVVDRAVELGYAGLRIDFGETRDTTLYTFLRDWLGELQTTPDAGFADALRNTVSGYYFYDTVGTKFRQTLDNSQSPTDFHQLLAKTEAPRSAFVSALITQSSGEAIFGSRFVSPAGEAVGTGETAADRFGNLPSGSSMNLLETDANDSVNTTRGTLLMVSKPASGNWTLEIFGRATGTVDVSLLTPTSGKNYRQIVLSGVNLTAGKKYRIVFQSVGINPVVLEEFQNGAYQPVGSITPVVNNIVELDPQVVGVMQVTPEVVGGGDKFGRLVGVLFSKPMTTASVEEITRYQIGGGNLVGSNPPNPVGKSISIVGASQNFGKRFVILGLETPVGPFIERSLSLNGIKDTSNRTLAAATRNIAMRVSPQGNPPGAYLTGRVMNADGTPIPNAFVSYKTDTVSRSVEGCGNVLPTEIARRKTDANGEYQLDYVREGECMPVYVDVVNPSNGSRKSLTSNVAYHGQHMILDGVFLARGNARGTVTNNGLPLANAYVNVVPELDVIAGKTVRTDSLGKYSVTDIPVGRVTVRAVGTGNFSNASGIGAGVIEGAGQTAVIDVSTQSISGEVRGKVVNPDSAQTPVSGTLVIASANIPGFPADGGTPVGYSFTDGDGRFIIKNLPIGNITLSVTNYVTGSRISQSVTLTALNSQVQNILFVLSGYGSVKGRVLDEIGQYIPSAIVFASGQAVQADVLGNYTLPYLIPGTHNISAKDPVTRQAGSATATVRQNEETTGIDVVIKRPANLKGQVFANENGTAHPLEGVKVTVDGYKIAETDAQGRYTLSDIPSGQTTVRFVFEEKGWFINSEVFLAPNELVIRNATFRPGRIHGRITQPDGVTGTVATVNLKTVRPYLLSGAYYGFPDEAFISTLSAANGTYSFEQLNPDNYRVSTSNEFFPIQISKSGKLPPNGDHEVNLSLVNTLAGRIHGTIYQTDGVTPVGEGIKVRLGGGSLADAEVRTDADGTYEFAEIFSEGGYNLTAIDSATGKTNRTSVYVRQNQESIVDLRLLGRGNLRVKVLDGGGNPVPGGSISVEGASYPNDTRFIDLTPQNGGIYDFTTLNEGSYAVSVSYNGSGGRASASVTNGGTTEVVIRLQASGTVTGRVFLPNGTTPSGLADVTLRQYGRIIGFAVSSDSEEELGKFTFQNVPEGDFTIDVFDNRTGRVGRSAGRIVQQSEIVTVNINLLALGTVVGQITQNGTPVSHSLVTISADGSGIAGATQVATSDDTGNYRFAGVPVGRVTVSVTNGPGGTTGSTSGTVAGTNEPLPELVLNVALTPSAKVAGTVFKNGGTQPQAGADVKLYSSGGVFSTISGENGSYQFNYIPLGEFRVRAEAPSGFDRGQTALLTTGQAGSTITADITMNGLGTITGEARDSDGGLLNRGTVTLTNNDWGTPAVMIASVQTNGRYSFTSVPAGNFTLKLTLADRIGAGTAAGSVAANQTLDIPLQLEPAAKITGNLKQSDGTTPAVGADITLSLSPQSGGFYTFYAHSDSLGRFSFDNLPLGSASILFTDSTTGGIARLDGQVLATNGQILDVGNVVLDNTPISVESVSPANNSVNVARNSAVQITFNEPAQNDSVNSGSVQLRIGETQIGANTTISTDGRVVTITPGNLLRDVTTYTVVVTTSVKDRNGLSLLQEFRSVFTTADETPPTVSAVSPSDGSIQVPVASHIVVNTSEPVAADLDFSQVVQVSNGLTNISGAISLDNTGRIITFTPTANLAESMTFTVTVNGLRDLAGNVQTQAFSSNFTTPDLTAPTINPLPIDGTTIRTFRPLITATYQDNFSGISTSSVVLTLDGVNVTANTTVTGSSLSYTPSANLTRGTHNITVQASDNAGNASSLRTASFTIDDSGPIISSFTIGGTPAIDGAQISSSLLPLFEVNYTDDTGIDASATKLYLGYNGATPTEVNATVTNTKLMYQPSAPMAEGNYVVRAVITNNLGTFTETGNINFVLDVDAPDIQSVTPNTGNQHGGTTVVLSGLRLLNTNNTAPVVTVGNSPATIINIAAGEPNQVTIITPAGAPGDAVIKVTTDRGVGNATFNYQPDPRTPFAVEADTRLLWHLDETGNGYFNAVDASPFGLHGTAANGNLLSTEGRFSNARTSIDDGRLLYTQNSFGLLNFASSGFTLETWIKTPQVSSQHQLLQLYNDYYGEIGTLYLETSGGLTGRIFAPNGTQWNVQMSPTVYDVDNNQWHHLAWVFDTTENKLKLYVDGELRAESSKPANFDVMRDHPSYSTRLHAYLHQNLALDELRASASAHSAQQILNTYLGTEGNLQTIVYGGNSSIIFALGTSNNISFSGYNLAGVSATATDSAGNPVQIQVVSSSATAVSLNVMVGNEAALGNAQITLTSSTNSVSIPFSIIDITRITPGVEADTRLLWHLDETGNGYFNAVDASPFGVHGISGNGNLLSTTGRFSNARTSIDDGRFLYTPNPFGLLDFASSGFTLETWIKTSQVSSQRQIMQLSNDAYGEVGTMYLEASGGLTGRILAPNGTQWNVSMPSTVYDIDNNQWHHLAWVFDVTGNKLKLYVDGELRAESSKPANFDVMRDYPGYSTRLFAYLSQNLALDEIRASASAHTTEIIRNDFLGVSEMRVTSTDYTEISRNSSTVSNQEFNIFGYNLENINAQIVKNGQPINVGISLTSSSFRQAKLNLSVQPDTPLGTAQLVITKQNQPTSTVNIRIVEKNPFVADIDTVLLWHLDEEGTGYVNAVDSGALGLHGTSVNGNLLSVPGRFSNARSSYDDGRYYYTANPFGALNFGANSMTMETWIKTPQVSNQKSILQLSNDAYGEVGTMFIETSGGMTARMFAPNGTQWSISMPPNAYDVDNNQWHHIALVIDRAEDKMKLYVDGEIRAESSKPANFDALRDYPGYPTRLYAFGHQNLAQDEIRVSSTALTAQRISSAYYGFDEFRIYRTYPPIVQKSETTQVFVTGYGFNNVSVTTNRADVAVNIVSATLSQLELGVTPSSSAALGEVQIVLTKPSGESLSTTLSVVDQKPFVTALDTVLLWHLDEEGTGYVNAVDSGALGLHGTSVNGNLLSVPGRFSNARSSYDDGRYYYTANPFGALNFGANSMTMETWIKTPQVSNQKSILQLSNDAYGEVGTMFIEGSGALSARFFSPNSTQWSVATARSYNPQTGFWQGRVDDNYWHHIALVLDRTENKLKLYVDGELRAETAKPANFDALRDYPGYPTRLYAFGHQNLAQDEIRISSTAFSAERVSESFYGFDHFRLYRTYPNIAQRGTENRVFVTGNGLNDVSVTPDRADVAVNIVSATSTQLELSIEPTAIAEPGNLQLTLMKPSGESLTTNINVVNQQPFSNNEIGTKLLWHLDETGTGYVNAVDSSGLGLHGTSVNGNLLSVPGRFSNARTAVDDGRYYYTANPFGALNFGANSMTMETWIKTPQVSNQKSILQLSNDGYGEVGTMYIEGSGALSARFFSPNSTQWSVATARSYNPQTGFWQGRVDDNYWHHIAFVLDRTQDKLKIYVDGELRAETAKPANFDMLRDYPGYPTRLYAFGHQNLAQDEIRVLDYARSSSQISTTWFGAPLNLGINIQNPIQTKITAQKNSEEKPFSRKNLQNFSKPFINNEEKGSLRLLQFDGKASFNRK